MAATLPSFTFQPFQFDLTLPSAHVKSEKAFHSLEDHEFDISKWLKLEEPLPLSTNSTSLFSEGRERSNSNGASTGISNSNSCNTTSGSGTHHHSSSNGNSHLHSNHHAFPFNAPSFGTTNNGAAPFPNYNHGFGNQSNCHSCCSQTAPSNECHHHHCNHSSSAAVPSSGPFPQFAQFATANSNIDFSSLNTQMSAPQLYQLFAQFQHLLKTQNEESNQQSEDKKRKALGRPFTRRIRQTRPKVVEAKGAVQCKGRNRKKGTQCRNAALMEYIGPRPMYCAEHIEADPKSLYEKCKSPYQKEVDDNKGCKEVVLKEFGLCYKHFHFAVNDVLSKRDFERAKKTQDRISELLLQLERDASAAKKKDGDLYQRKNKLIPKFQEMKKQINRAVEILEHRRKFEDATPGSQMVDLYLPPDHPEIVTAEEMSPSAIFELSDEESMGSFTSPEIQSPEDFSE